MTDFDDFEALMAEIEGKPTNRAAVRPEEPSAIPDIPDAPGADEDHKHDPRTVRAAVLGVLGIMHADLENDGPADGSDWREAYNAAAQTLADAIGWTPKTENRET
ncbi:hypothetical protein FIU86_04360 [Roseovarius sp. THAF9]|uniref:hypothetical protein n=1 Tax=Roseovarius sp. THAF9 TaxID=2587847 RepID=UPI001267D35C|nr:hypothetical protein [Roseovarius sp. THAF9]QFT92064.1 hypothetical protein FIU86_04360 [Roseovarius sp. THAF9]